MICVPIGERCMCEQTGTKMAERTDVQNGPGRETYRSNRLRLQSMHKDCRVMDKRIKRKMRKEVSGQDTKYMKL